MVDGCEARLLLLPPVTSFITRLVGGTRPLNSRDVYCITRKVAAEQKAKTLALATGKEGGDPKSRFITVVLARVPAPLYQVINSVGRILQPERQDESPVDPANPTPLDWPMMAPLRAH